MKFKYFDNNKRYYTLNYFYRKKFNSKIAKISLDGNFTCPNIDGSKARGGCIFCRSGSSSADKKYLLDLDAQFEEKISSLSKKWSDAKFILYFQANTNTYDTVENLKKRFEPLLLKDKVVGLSLGTRDDAFNDEIYDYLADLNQRTYLTIELGLQTINPITTKLINRASDLNSFEKCVNRLRSLKIDVVVHIINGLPYETRDDMLNNIKYLNKLKIQGIKIHNLFIEEGTMLNKLYEKERFPMLSRDEYVSIVCDQIELLNSNIVIHRLTGDPDEKYLVEPKWVVKKFVVMNEIDKELVRRNTIQGYHQSVINYARHIWEEELDHIDTVVDATLGNGHDSLYMANIVRNGKVYGLDIQEDALINSNKLFKENSLSNVETLLLDHSKIDTIIERNKVKLVHFNLGYLPGNNKNIVTRVETTIEALRKSYNLLKKHGLITIVVYPGHEEGLKESKALLEEIKNYNHKILRNTQKEKSPYLIVIKKQS